MCDKPLQYNNIIINIKYFNNHLLPIFLKRGNNGRKSVYDILAYNDSEFQIECYSFSNSNRKCYYNQYFVFNLGDKWEYCQINDINTSSVINIELNDYYDSESDDEDTNPFEIEYELLTINKIIEKCKLTPKLINELKYNYLIIPSLPDPSTLNIQSLQNQ